MIVFVIFLAVVVSILLFPVLVFVPVVFRIIVLVFVVVVVVVVVLLFFFFFLFREELGMLTVYPD